MTAGLDAVRAWCGWHIAPSQTETLEVEGEGSRVLLLPSLKVTAISEVRDESGSVVADTEYKWRSNGIIRGRWTCEELYSFDVTHGYEEMPSELQAVIDQIDATGVGARAASAQTSGPFSVSYGSTDLESQPLSVRSVIARYKLPPRP